MALFSERTGTGVGWLLTGPEGMAVQWWAATTAGMISHCVMAAARINSDGFIHEGVGMWHYL